MTEPGTSVVAVETGTSPGELLRFERLLSEVSSSLIDLPNRRIDEVIDQALRRIVTTLGIDRSTLLDVDPASGRFHATHSWAQPGFLPTPTTLSSRAYPWAMARFLAGQPVVYSRLADMPPEAAIDVASAASIGLLSNVSIPVLVAGKLVAILAFGSMREERAWPDELVARMRLLAQAFGSALARKHTQDRIDAQQALEHLLFEHSISLAGASGPTLDAELHAALGAIARLVGADRITLWRIARVPGRLLATHQWLAHGAAAGAGPTDCSELPWIIDGIVAGNVVRRPAPARNAPGVDAGPAPQGSPRAEPAALLAIPIRDAGAMTGALSLSCSEAERTWRDEMVPALGVFGRLLLSALDYRDAERNERQAIAEAAQAREQLAHLARVEAVGAMSVAITHEVNQPLAAIANYVRAGRRRLADEDPIDRAKLDGILGKIGGQVALAGEVLDRLRAMVRRREPREDRIDLARLIGRALRFIELDCRQGGIEVETVLAPDLPAVLGDGIQIKQVLMNLAHNAIEAMADVPARQRVLRIEARPADDEHVVVGVADRGPGLDAAAIETLFEPFRTSKGNGMGIGLSICRTLVEAHGGTLWHEVRPGGGALFQFSLPRARGEA